MEEQGLIIAVRRRPGYVLVTVSGEVDVTTAGQLRGRLEGPAGGGRQVIIDFSGVTFIDAAGVGVLAGAAARAAARGGSLRLAAAGRQVRRVLALTGLDRSIPLAATVAEARAALRSDPGSRANGLRARADRARRAASADALRGR
jgi:anti-sigma B factor antagonist